MPPKSATLKDLQKGCKAQGLDPKGGKAGLVGRLRGNVNVGAPSAKEHGESGGGCDAGCDAGCEAVLVVRSELEDEEEMKRDARAVLEKAVVEEEFHLETVKVEHFVANRRGLRYARDKMDKRDFGARVLVLEEIKFRRVSRSLRLRAV